MLLAASYVFFIFWAFFAVVFVIYRLLSHRAHNYMLLAASYVFFIFWVFFAVVFVLYRLLSHRAQNYMLLAASYVFYAYWDWRFLFVMLFSTVVDYYAAIGIGRSESKRVRKTILLTSITLQLGLLGVFKYYGFFSQELSGLFTELGLPVSLPVLNF